MSKAWKKGLIVMLLLGVLGMSWQVGAQQSGDKIKIVVVGDSTASNYSAAQAPRTGWAQTFQQFFTSEVEVKNHAASGRSSKSFIAEGRLTAALRDLNAGDYLFIQFGHNDAKSDDASRYTSPFTTFKETLMTYIEAAREKGAFPVLLTPIERRRFNNGVAGSSHGNYPVAMIQLGQELDVPVIDMTSKTRVMYNQLGTEKTKEIFLWLASGEHPNYPNGIEDNTHLQEYGAIEVGKLVVAGLKELNLPLVDFLK